ncbi:MAG: GNAT family N-acetyltransferase [Candidatus Omnitrophica bacterium]|nr:GNAT family N-acetyltransferase [Candidatus Omnitrophota bacterium]
MLKVDIITSIEKMEGLREPWNDALSRSASDDVHLTWEWFYTWCDNFAKEDLFIIVVKDEGGKILAIAPFARKTYRFLGLPVKKTAVLRNCYSPRINLILTERIKECVEAIFDRLGAEKWDVIKLEDIISDSKIIKELESLSGKDLFRFYKGKRIELSPYVTVAGKWEDYYSALSSRFRKNIKYSERKLGNVGKVELLEIKNSDKLDVYLEKFFQLEASGWKKDAKTAIRCSKKERRFYSELAHIASRNHWFSLFFLKVDDKEIAACYSFRYKDVFSGEKQGYDPDYASYSPGSLLHKRMLEKVFENNFRKYDLLGVYENWKRKWTLSADEIRCVWIYRRNILGNTLYYIRVIKDYLRRFHFLRKLKGICLYQGRKVFRYEK